MSFRIISAAEAASMINHNDNVGFSGFTPAGSPKEITLEIAKRAIIEHENGREFKIGMFTGASTGDSVDGALARANAVKFRTPYQSNKDMRAALNAGQAPYFDLHLSELAQQLRYGFMGSVDVAIIEACDITADGKIYVTTGVGIAPTICMLAKKIFIELNAVHSQGLKGMHDIYQPLDPPCREAIPVMKPSSRIGQPYIQVDPAKIVGIVETNRADETGGFSPSDPITEQIGANVAAFLASEIRAGRIPASFLPLQSGVGNIANAVLAALGLNKEIPAFEMYTEVLQDSVVSLMREGRIKFSSTCSLTVSKDCLQGIYQDINFFYDKIILRPQEISNNPEVARRLGLITINTALEADIFGNINSTHVLGSKMMNGIGGSGDFTRNAYMSIFTCPSVAKGGKISAIVPMVSHMDHSEHSVKVLITEQGVADLRGKSPMQKAQTIIENCVHPNYKQLLWDYLKIEKGVHTPLNIQAALAFHSEFCKSGDMTLTDLSQYAK